MVPIPTTCIPYLQTCIPYLQHGSHTYNMHPIPTTCIPYLQHASHTYNIHPIPTTYIPYLQHASHTYNMVPIPTTCIPYLQHASHTYNMHPIPTTYIPYLQHASHTYNMHPIPTTWFPYLQHVSSTANNFLTIAGHCEQKISKSAGQTHILPVIFYTCDMHVSLRTIRRGHIQKPLFTNVNRFNVAASTFPLKTTKCVHYLELLFYFVLQKKNKYSYKVKFAREKNYTITIFYRTSKIMFILVICCSIYIKIKVHVLFCKQNIS